MKKPFFTVFFMVITSVFFITALAVVNEVSREQIEANEEIRRIQSIMYACNIFPEGVHESNMSPAAKTTDIVWDENLLLSMMEERMQGVRLPIGDRQKRLVQNSFLALRDSAEIMVLFMPDHGIAGYGFSLRGKGLWGSIGAFAVISPDLSQMVGIDFTEQVETPGLGARITESWFKYLFRGLDLKPFLSQNESPNIVMVGKKSQSNLEESTNSVEAITGATQTCNGVLNMVNTDLSFYISLIQENQEIFNQMQTDRQKTHDNKMD
jgi:Na+-transporting NADH:ubiquinone oxidoreductase subunit C